MADLGKMQGDTYLSRKDARWIAQAFRELAPQVRNLGGKVFGGKVQWIRPQSDSAFTGLDAEPDFAVNAFFPAAHGYKARNDGIGYTLKLSVWDEGEQRRDRDARPGPGPPRLRPDHVLVPGAPGRARRHGTGLRAPGPAGNRPRRRPLRIDAGPALDRASAKSSASGTGRPSRREQPLGSGTMVTVASRAPDMTVHFSSSDAAVCTALDVAGRVLILVKNMVFIFVNIEAAPFPHVNVPRGAVSRQPPTRALSGDPPTRTAPASGGRDEPMRRRQDLRIIRAEASLRWSGQRRMA